MISSYGDENVSDRVWGFAQKQQRTLYTREAALEQDMSSLSLSSTQSLGRNRLPSLSTSTVSTLEEDTPVHTGLFPGMFPPLSPSRRSFSATCHAEMHGLSSLVNQRREWSSPSLDVMTSDSGSRYPISNHQDVPSVLSPEKPNSTYGPAHDSGAFLPGHLLHEDISLCNPAPHEQDCHEFPNREDEVYSPKTLRFVPTDSFHRRTESRMCNIESNVNALGTIGYPGICDPFSTFLSSMNPSCTLFQQNLESVAEDDFVPFVGTNERSNLTTDFLKHENNVTVSNVLHHTCPATQKLLPAPASEKYSKQQMMPVNIYEDSFNQVPFNHHHHRYYSHMNHSRILNQGDSLINDEVGNNIIMMSNNPCDYSNRPYQNHRLPVATAANEDAALYIDQQMHIASMVTPSISALACTTPIADSIPPTESHFLLRHFHPINGENRTHRSASEVEPCLQSEVHKTAFIPTLNVQALHMRNTASFGDNMNVKDLASTFVLSSVPPNLPYRDPIHHTGSHALIAINSTSLLRPTAHIPSLQSHSAIQVGNQCRYNVKFKRSTDVYLYEAKSPKDEFIVGSFVKVEADRGEDMGVVVSKLSVAGINCQTDVRQIYGRNDQNRIESSDKSKDETTTTLKKILRLATTDEIGRLDVKRKDEDGMLSQCKAKVLQRGLSMNVLDAEYQFDRNKLTFFFQAQGRIDFRDLVRDLFSLCKTRIWMQQIDKKGYSPDGTV